MKNIIAPRPAPADMPRSPGSARLFLRRDCKTMPEQPKEAPTKSAFKDLGNLISKIIFFNNSVSSPVEKSFSEKMLMLPNDIEAIKEITSKTNSKNNILKLRFKLLYI